jgi:hypothetical protein
MNRIIPVVLVGLAVALVLGVWLLRPKSPAVSASAPVHQGGARLVIEGARPNSVQVASQPSEMRAILPEHITLSMIQELRERGGRKVLVFIDGSELELNPYQLSQLPSEVRLRLEYRRGGQ